MLCSTPMPSSASAEPRIDPPGVVVSHRVPGFSEQWVIPEVPVPEAGYHDRALRLLVAILEYWIRFSSADAGVYRNLVIRPFEAKPSVGFDPDMLLLEPAPADPEALSSLRLWEPDCPKPALAIEVVSARHPYKDYVEIPDQCAAVGVQELVVFDPLLVGPKAHGGPKRLQVWQRRDSGAFERVHAGDGPAFSPTLRAWWVVTDGARRVRVAANETGGDLWPTGEEAARAERDAALTRVAELEAELAKLRK